MAGTMTPQAQIGMAIRAKLPMIMLVTLALMTLLTIVRGESLSDLSFTDPDAALRFVQVRDLLAGQGWWDLTQYRLQPPEGLAMHWTRLVDIPLVLVIAIFEPLLGQAVAEKLALVLVPGLTLFTILVGGWMLTLRLVDMPVSPDRTVLLALSLPILSFSLPMNIDHHGWQAAFLLLIAAGLADPQRRLGAGALAGVFTALSMVIGAESLPMIGVAGLCLVIVWLRSRQRYGQMVRGYGLGIVATLMISFPVFVPVEAWLVGACDVLSMPYMLAMGGAGLVLVAGSTLPAGMAHGRAAMVVLAGLAAVLALTLSLYPECRLGPMGSIDPRLDDWLGGIAEAKPGYAVLLKQPHAFFSVGINAMLGLGFAIYFWRRRSPGGESRLGWLVVVVMLATAVLLGLIFQARLMRLGAPLAAVPSMILISMLLKRIRSWPSMLGRVFGAAAVLSILPGILPTLLIKGLTTNETPETAQADGGADDGESTDRNEATVPNCQNASGIKPIANLPTGHLLASLDVAPMILVHTPHGVLAGNYHRAPDMILANLGTWEAEPKAAMHLLRANDIDYVAVCADDNRMQMIIRAGKDSLAAQLVDGLVPKGLAPVDLPAGGAYSVYRVIEAEGDQR